MRLQRITVISIWVISSLAVHSQETEKAKPPIQITLDGVRKVDVIAREATRKVAVFRLTNTTKQPIEIRRHSGQPDLLISKRNNAWSA